MSIFHNNSLIGSSGQGGYTISRSLRFNSADSAFLSRTPASAGNRKTWTWAGWMKRSSFATFQMIFQAGNVNASEIFLYFIDGTLRLYQDTSSSVNFSVATTGDLRDPSAWYHFVIAVDTTQATSTNRVKLYVNGVDRTNTADTFPSLNLDTYINSTQQHFIGTRVAQIQYLGAYLADIHFIDGQALTPTSFGEFSATTGVWVPKAYTGTYGTNGFRLTFADNSAATATTLGKDAAGSNNWTPNNLSVTAGAGNDSLVDVPVNGSEVDTGLGAQVRGNYCTLNPLDRGTAGAVGIVLSNGNLNAVTPSDAITSVRGTIGVSSGKWYWEVTPTVDGSTAMIGVGLISANLNSYAGVNASSWGYYADGNKYFQNISSSYGSAYGNGDVIGVALDVDSGALTFYKNGVSQGQAFTGLSGTLFPMLGDGGTIAAVALTANFGQRPFAYTAPSGFKALCTANLPAPTITQPSTVMDVKLWTGNGSTQTISGLGFSPDFVWLKGRSVPYPHGLHDTVRGVNRFLISSTTDAEIVNEQDGFISAFTSDGFTISPGSRSSATFNQNSATYAGWCWDAGSSTVTNTQGSISSQVRANASAGFSIVKWNGTSANATIGHGLGIAPQLIIRKYTNDTDDWYTYHVSAGTNKYFSLNRTTEALTSTSIWQNTAPTSSIFYIGGGNNNSNSIAYCFAPVAGYSAFGSYTGNGSTDGPFVYTGFRPRWVMIKRSDNVGSWGILDTARNTFNVQDKLLWSNLSDAEGTFTIFDVLSNGFKLRESTNGYNTSGGTYIYAAFAESPFGLNNRAR
jgi:hypothetical protein